MKVFFIANSAWYLDNFRRSTLLRFADLYDVTCLYSNVDRCDDLVTLNVKRKPFFLDATSANPFKESWSLICLTLLLIFDRPGVLFSFNPKTNLYSLIACWLLRIPCVPNVSGVGVASQLKGPLGKLYRSLAGFFYRRAAHVFFQNEDDYQAFLKMGWVSPDKAEVIPGSGVDLVKFQPHSKETTTFRFLMAARLIKPKGVIEYLKAAKQVVSKGHECEFLLAGIYDNSSRAIDVKMLSDLGCESKIDFIGHVTDMPELLKNIDCVVLPSYYPEGIPRSLIEAAAAGKMIITTDTPGCREVVASGENGLFVAAKDVSQLAEAMLHLVELPKTQQRAMSDASRKLAESCFDENIVIDRYLDVAENHEKP